MAKGIDAMMCRLTESISHLHFTPKSRRTLLKLPQEIQDVIFDLAYPHLPDFRYVTRGEWDASEKERSRREGKGYIRQPFPTPKVCDFLVSKAFFEAAAKAYVGNQVFDETLDRPKSRHSSLFHPFRPFQGVISKYVTAVVLDRFLDLEEHLPATVKSVTLSLGWLDFDILEPRYAWQYEYDDADFAVIMRKFNGDKISGLHEFHIIADYCPYLKSPDNTKIWTQNVRGLEAFIRPYATRPRFSSTRPPAYPDNARPASLFRPSNVTSQAPMVAEDSTTWGSANTKRRSSMWTSLDTTSKPRKRLRSVIGDADIPRDVEGLKVLLETRGDEVMKWIDRLKRRAARTARAPAF